MFIKLVIVTNYCLSFRKKEKGSDGQGAAQTHGICTDIIAEPQAEWISKDQSLSCCPEARLTIPMLLLKDVCLTRSLRPPRMNTPQLPRQLILVLYYPSC